MKIEMIKFLIIRSLDHNQWNDQEDVRQVSFQDPALQKPEVKALIITTTTIIIITIVIIIIIIVIIIVIIIIIIVIIIVLIIIIIDSIKKVLFCPGRFSLFICPILGNIKRDLFVDLWFRKCKYIYWSNRSRYLFHEKKNCRLTITFMQEHGFGFLDGFEHGRDINTGMEVAPFCRSTSSALAFRFQIFQMAPTFGRFYRRLFFLTIWPIFNL